MQPRWETGKEVERSCLIGESHICDISVVIPLYNKAPYIARALQSVLSQTLLPIEIIVVDDGSTDDGPAAVERFADERIRLIRQSNQGVSAARNSGIEHSSSPLIAFLDADDEWCPDFLHEIAALVSRFPTAGVYCTRYALSSGHTTVSDIFQNVPTGPDGGIVKNYFCAALSWEPLSSSSMVCRREALKEIGGFPLGVVMGEDNLVWRELALRYPVAWSNKCCAVYHLAAINRTVGKLYIGHIPVDCKIGQHLSLSSISRETHQDLFEYDVRWRLKFIKSNWLGGQKMIVREMVNRSKGSRKFKFTLWKWWLLSYVPTFIAVSLWRLKQVLNGRSPSLPKTALMVKEPRSPS